MKKIKGKKKCLSFFEVFLFGSRFRVLIPNLIIWEQKECKKEGVAYFLIKLVNSIIVIEKHNIKLSLTAVDILTHYGRKSTGVTKIINYGSAPLVCPLKN